MELELRLIKEEFLCTWKLQHLKASSSSSDSQLDTATIITLSSSDVWGSLLGVGIWGVRVWLRHDSSRLNTGAIIFGSSCRISVISELAWLPSGRWIDDAVSSLIHRVINISSSWGSCSLHLSRISWANLDESNGCFLLVWPSSRGALCLPLWKIEYNNTQTNGNVIKTQKFPTRKSIVIQTYLRGCNFFLTMCFEILVPRKICFHEADFEIVLSAYPKSCTKWHQIGIPSLTLYCYPSLFK